MKTKSYLIYVIFLVLIITSQSHASEGKQFITLAAGNAAIFDDDVENPLVVKIEYRYKPLTSVKVVPAVGLAVSKDDAAALIFFAERDFYIAKNWVLALNFGPSLFTNGDDIDLGAAVQFRTGIRLHYEFSNNFRLGAELFHLSNAGFGDENPGTEPFFVSLFVPF